MQLAKSSGREDPTMKRYLAVWAIVFSLISATHRDYLSFGLPPMWDSLVYQISGLTWLHSFFDGNKAQFLQSIGTGQPIGYIFSLTLGYLLFGVREISPYLVGTFFAVACLWSCYILSQKLGAKKNIALYGVVLFSLLPNFIYQNLYQSRNDYAATVFFSFGMIYFLDLLETPTPRNAFISGILFGVSILFKLSLPGYLIWAPAIFLLFPGLAKKQLSFLNRVQILGWVLIGGILACSWYYLPTLKNSLGYLSYWSKMSNWKAIQYGLSSTFQHVVFYPKNLFNLHFFPYSWLIFFGIVGLVCRGLKISRTRSNLRQWAHHGPNIVAFSTIVLSLALITFTDSLASIGDIPLLPIIVALTISLISVLFEHGKFQLRFAHNVFIFLVLSVTSLAFIPHVKKTEIGKDFPRFSRELRTFAEQFAIDNVSAIQVFSHPIYNIDTLRWAWLSDRSGSLSYLSLNPQEVKMVPENVQSISNGIESAVFVIMSPKDVTSIGGEKFHTFNRLQREISNTLIATQNYVAVGHLSLESGHLPLDLYLRKDFSSFRLASADELYSDGWIESGAQVQVLTLSPAKLRISGVPANPWNEVVLTGENRKIRLKQVQGDERVSHYESDTLSPTLLGKEILRLTFSPDLSPSLNANGDTRNLLLRNPKFEVIR